MNVNLTPQLEEMIKKKWLPASIIQPVRLSVRHCASWKNKIAFGLSSLSSCAKTFGTALTAASSPLGAQKK